KLGSFFFFSFTSFHSFVKKVIRFDPLFILFFLKKKKPPVWMTFLLILLRLQFIFRFCRQDAFVALCYSWSLSLVFILCSWPRLGICLRQILRVVIVMWMEKANPWTRSQKCHLSIVLVLVVVSLSLPFLGIVKYLSGLEEQGSIHPLH